MTGVGIPRRNPQRITALIAMAAIVVSAMVYAGESFGNSESSAAEARHDPPISSTQILQQNFETLKVGGIAQPKSRASEKPATSTLSDAEARDLAFLADNSGRTVDELAEQYRGGQEFTGFITWLSDEYPDYFTHAAFDYPGLVRPRVTLTKYPPQAVIDKANQLPIEIDLRFGANATEDELMSLSAAAVNAAVAQFGRDTVPHSSIDEETISIEVTVKASPQPIDSVRMMQGIVADQYRDGANLLPVEVSYTFDPTYDAPSTHAENIRGGYKLTRGATGNLNCTSGFSVKRNGVLGVVTAGHCDNNLRYKAKANVLAFVTEHPFYNMVEDVDVQFHKTLAGHTTQKKFRADIGEVRTVTASAIPAIGLPICKFGLTTNRTCTQIIDTGKCTTFLRYPSNLLSIGNREHSNYS
ncbi:hypothetical protein SAMN06309944_0728 [Micrococcales bacterium KH10]|nr:hypothetical protein SAMN06309944_0728 [Micrococcales bacterium KH10]